MLCLRVPSDERWILHARAHLDEVLSDHAHCEMKAAANALSLAARHPGNLPLVRALSRLAREEMEHFERVVEELERRSIPLGAPPVDVYAASLRKVIAAVSAPRGISPLVDRLLVAALIEARSCERFKGLAEGLGDEHEGLRAFYRELLASEARHYRDYVDLAKAAAGPDFEGAVHARLAILSDREADIVRGLAGRGAEATVHG
jgi:tRNA-(ms[2]io[6]A)-hydroxylase